ncbi:TRAP transporter small permease [Alkalihalobacillus sp. TS-13]|uniref:TRAP transporter small permease n=1 Tax=Alkalihalobacillus sp. TS-13 TaxID=2842455 RepID=UPI001C876B06|nr:TRAP transporter small permease [Alkalihalobacillus sp. TS-13]
MKRFVQVLERLQMTVAILFLSIFFFVIMLQIITRHLGISIIWTEEVANYSFIWAIFMGAAIMVNRREHFNFDFILKNLKGKRKTSLKIVNDLVLITFNVFIFLLGVQVAVEFWNYTWASIPDMKMGYIWMSVPIMAGTMIIYSFSHLIDHVQTVKAGQVHTGKAKEVNG